MAEDAKDRAGPSSSAPEAPCNLDQMMCKKNKTFSSCKHPSLTDGPFLGDNLGRLEAYCRDQMKVAELDIRDSIQSLEEAQKELDEADGSRNAAHRREIDAMRSRVDMMEEKVRLGAEEIVKLTADKEIAQKRRMDVQGLKMRAEIAVRMAECEALQQRLKLFESDSAQDAEKVPLEAEDKVRQSKAELDRIQSDMKAREDEEKLLMDLLEEAEASRLGSAQVLHILREQLGRLESSLLSSATCLNRVNKLKSTAAKQVGEFTDLETRLAKIVYLQSVQDGRQKGKDWMTTVAGFGAAADIQNQPADKRFVTYWGVRKEILPTMPLKRKLDGSKEKKKRVKKQRLSRKLAEMSIEDVPATETSAMETDEVSDEAAQQPAASTSQVDQPTEPQLAVVPFVRRPQSPETPRLRIPFSSLIDLFGLCPPSIPRPLMSLSGTFRVSSSLWHLPLEGPNNFPALMPSRPAIIELPQDSQDL